MLNLLSVVPKFGIAALFVGIDLRMSCLYNGRYVCDLRISIPDFMCICPATNLVSTIKPMTRVNFRTVTML